MLYIIGLGLGDEQDITLRGLQAVKSCDALFLEAYTSILPGISKTKLVITLHLSLIVIGRVLWKTNH